MIPAVYNRLLELTKSPVAPTSIAAIYALGEGGDPIPVIVNRLLELTNHPVQSLSEAAIKALGRIFRHGHS